MPRVPRRRVASVFEGGLNAGADGGADRFGLVRQGGAEAAQVAAGLVQAVEQVQHHRKRILRKREILRQVAEQARAGDVDLVEDRARFALGRAESSPRTPRAAVRVP